MSALARAFSRCVFAEISQIDELLSSAFQAEDRPRISNPIINDSSEKAQLQNSRVGLTSNGHTFETFMFYFR
jgi:hypothetical protein